MRIRKGYAVIIAALIVGLSVPCAAYTAQKGDSYWKISKSYGTDFSELLKVNKKTAESVLNIGDAVLIPGIDAHIAKGGDTYWKIAKKYNISFSKLLEINNADASSELDIGQVVYLTQTEPAEPWVSYTTYKIKSGDTLWGLAEKYGIPCAELCGANKMSENTVLYIGMSINVPVHHVPETPRISEKYGEYLDWWTQAQYVVPTGAEFTVADFYTGKSFMAKRTTGANHADCEPLTSSDTAAMKKIWGGAFSWSARPVLIHYNGRVIAASAASYEHGGNENAAGGAWTSWRSGDYGAGYNYDWVKGNDYNGHFDIHFLNSTTHNTGKISEEHQKNIKIAAGR